MKIPRAIQPEAPGTVLFLPAGNILPFMRNGTHGNPEFMENRTIGAPLFNRFLLTSSGIISILSIQIVCIMLVMSD
ncbi:MAG: hypothetical protein DYH02_06835 [Candidatus Omnitrophica bacterium COP1]|nr:hypothetical protein [Candidatus Omnitrophica bacterium COP1]